PAMIIGLVSLKQANQGMESLAFNSLEAVREIKKAQLEQYFTDRRSDMRALVSVAGTLRLQALEKLKAVREVKKSAIENYFHQTALQIQSFTENRATKDALVKFKDSFKLIKFVNKLDDKTIAQMRSELAAYYGKELPEYFDKHLGANQASTLKQYLDALDEDAVITQYYYIVKNKNALGEKLKLNRATDKSGYSKAHYFSHPTIRNFQQKFGYEDIYMIDARSDRVIYSVNKDIDFGTDLKAGPNAQSPLAEIYQRAKKAGRKEHYLSSDFSIYYPSQEKPSLFVAAPVRHYGGIVGVVVFQLNIDQINSIMKARTGLGETGETYLVGSDLRMRSDSNTDTNRSVQQSLRAVANSDANSAAIEAALSGETATGIVSNYLQKPVLSAWTPLSVSGLNWALLADIDVSEALSPVDEFETAFYQEYARQYGYPDLYLINPNGYAFFSATEGRDVRTNLLTGEYSDSSLAALVRDVSQTKRFGFSDFTPYRASSNEPSAFMAQPLVSGSGKVELIIALKLPLDGINSITGIRDGMGESGESYLVGPDFRMRSDSYKDPENRSVSASFAGSIQDNGIETRAVTQALAGTVGSEIIEDAQGRSVLSAYTPLEVNGVTWALMAEIEQQEAFATAEQLKWLTLGILLISVVVIVFVGYIMSSRISKPLVGASQLAKQVAAGDLSSDIQVQREDEIGELQDALKEMNSGLKDMVAQISLSAEQQASAAEELSLITDQTRDHVREQNAGTQQVEVAISEMSATIQEVNRNTMEATVAAEQADQEAKLGSREVRNTIGSIHEFATEVDHMADTLKEVEEGANNIGGIVDVINDIADQTNLLALNASIEAARAGDQGRGFAVVADEVRTLAKSTQGSTKQIEQMVVKLQKGAQASAQAMSRGKVQMEQVITQAENTGSALDKISESISQINMMTQSIATAYQQQSSVTEEVNKNIALISELSLQTGGDSEQIMRASEELAKLAAALQKQTHRFKM
ncbi:MAG: methyl-accepting chemotaxis protein, partial [Pseudomonadales bacterium]